MAIYIYILLHRKMKISLCHVYGISGIGTLVLSVLDSFCHKSWFMMFWNTAFYEWCILFFGLDFKKIKKTQYKQLLQLMLILNFIIILTLDVAVISQAHRALFSGYGWLDHMLFSAKIWMWWVLACLRYTIMAWWLGIGTLYFISHVTATVNMSELCAAYTLALQRKTWLQWSITFKTCI